MAEKIPEPTFCDVPLYPRIVYHRGSAQFPTHFASMLARRERERLIDEAVRRVYPFCHAQPEDGRAPKKIWHTFEPEFAADYAAVIRREFCRLFDGCGEA